MNRLFVYTESFLNCWKAMGLNDIHLRILENILLVNPEVAPVIPKTGGARKLRISLSNNRGKSSGARVIYVDIFDKKKHISYLHIQKMFKIT